MIRHLLVCLAVLLLITASAGIIVQAMTPPQRTGDAAASVVPQRLLIERYCTGCHNSRTKAGGLLLDEIMARSVDENAEAWEKVLRKLRTRTMPPSGSARPAENEYEVLVSSLETALDRFAAGNIDPGRTDTFRRLNRREYRNVIRDLLHLDVDVESLLPADESNFGFDNVGIAALSPTLMERYLAAAQRVSRMAIGSSVRSPGGATVLVPPDRTQDRHIDGLPFGTRGGTVFQHQFPSDADYEIQIRLARNVDDHIQGLTEPHQLEFTLDGERIKLFTVEPPLVTVRNAVDRQLEEGLFSFRIPVRAGPRELAVTFIKRPSVRLESERQPYYSSFGDRHPRTQPAVESVSVLGPYAISGAGDTPSRQRVFVCRPATPSEELSCAKTIVSTLARRAFRRPVTDADLSFPLELYERRAGAGFEAGIEAALRALLVSPQFLFRVEQPPAAAAGDRIYRIGDLDLASRLSFFLWSSIPDDELLNAAIGETLRQPPVLRRQVERMLADSRSEALVANFSGQWLYLRNLEEAQPDPRLFTDFDDNLRQALRRETELFVASIVRENRSVLDLLSADYTFLNERLAKHYRIPNVYGSHFRRVTLADSSVRGGLLGQGSILTVTSYATRTSPVLRGKWMLENIIGTPPPPPPPDVPPLEETAAAGRILSMRERMAQHRKNPACSSCHQLMDPVGLSLENFDAIGRWRNVDETRALIDASGGLPDGSKFAGMAGLRQALLTRPEVFVTTLTEKLLTYALGRGLAYHDAPVVRRIVRDARAGDYEFASIVHGIVNSTPFQWRRSQ